MPHAAAVVERTMKVQDRSTSERRQHEHAAAALASRVAVGPLT
jgi:hypothetical protein